MSNSSVANPLSQIDSPLPFLGISLSYLSKFKECTNDPLITIFLLS
jgi:hypothetical protein